MKKLVLTCSLLTGLLFGNSVFADEVYSVKELQKAGIFANSPLKKQDLQKARVIMLSLHNKTAEGVENGKGPFYAEIYDKEGNLVAAASNSVVEENCSLNHAEMNALRKAHQYYESYDLAPKDLTIYINAEPCIMCTGAIMWSGVKTIYYSVPSKDVEKITGFDEGFKPNWIKEFKKRGIAVYGNIESQLGKKVLQDYVSDGKEVYKPSR